MSMSPENQKFSNAQMCIEFYMLCNFRNTFHFSPSKSENFTFFTFSLAKSEILWYT